MQVKTIAECSNGSLEHSAIILTFIRLPFVIKIIVFSIFEWRFFAGFTVVHMHLEVHSILRLEFSSGDFITCCLVSVHCLLGKGGPLGSLVCYVLLCFCHFPTWCLGSGVVLNCIDS